MNQNGIRRRRNFKEMLYYVVLVNLILLSRGASSSKEEKSDGAGDFGMGKLISRLRNDANLDLSVDEEYEDLRAELLAYHTALASLASQPDTRRSMMTTPCWTLGGICVNHKLCTGYRFLTEIPGCKDKLNVCCFTWNRYEVKDFRHEGIGNMAMPWTLKHEFGGEGIKEVDKAPKKKRKSRKQKRRDARKTLALIIKSK